MIWYRAVDAGRRVGDRSRVFSGEEAWRMCVVERVYVVQMCGCRKRYILGTIVIILSVELQNHVVGVYGRERVCGRKNVYGDEKM